MTKKNNNYNETQYTYVLLIFVLSLFPEIIIYFFIDNKSEAETFLFTILTSGFIGVLLGLLFYKLTITITENYVIAKFGIGIIKKQIEIADIKIVETTQIPWYTGIGIRIINFNTTQYNAKIGSGVKFILENKNYILSSNSQILIIESLEKHGHIKVKINQ